MPRSQQSHESRVLDYFKSAPLAAVLVVIGLAKEVVKARQTHKPVNAAPPKAKPAPAAAVAPRKKAKAKKKPLRKAAKPLDEAEIDNLSENP